MVFSGVMLMTTFDNASLAELRQRLAGHPLTGALDSLDHLRQFMSLHIYTLWDYRVLLGALQQALVNMAPFKVQVQAVEWIKQCLADESSCSAALPMADGCGFSQFEIYNRAMQEVGADAAPARQFIQRHQDGDVHQLLNSGLVPPAARDFVETTLGLMAEYKAPVLAAVLVHARAVGVTATLKNCAVRVGLNAQTAPALMLFLECHARRDQTLCAASAQRMVLDLCGADAGLREEAFIAVEEALCARLRLWDEAWDMLTGEGQPQRVCL